MQESPVAEYGESRRPDKGTGPRRADASMSLLNDLMTNTLDEDYASVAEDRGDGAPQSNRAGFVGLVAATLAFGAMLAVSAVQTDRSRPADEEERAQLIERINLQGDANDELRAEADVLERSVAALESEVAEIGGRQEALERSVRRLGVQVGSQAVVGPGMQVIVDDAEDPSAGHQGQVVDADLQLLVNGLWVAGAEAVSINGQRITTRTSIRGAAKAITVNFKSLERPYVVSAIGDPDTLQARFFETAAGQAWFDYQNNFGVKFETQIKERMTVPARGVGRLRYADQSPSKERP
ncbi:MAG: DUF881 domain-containing protein [Nocardioidaceae bacterium]